MIELVVGVGQVSLLLRHAQSLKDKRQVLRGIIQKLKNEGFSVTECAYADVAKRASVGFAYIGTQPERVKAVLDRGLRFFDGHGEIVGSHTEIFDYTGEIEITRDWDAEPEDFD